MSWVYFCLVDRKQIMIGETGGLLVKRLNQHRRHKLGEHEVTLLAALNGSRNEEQNIGWYFEKDAIESLRPRGKSGAPEVFEPTPRVTNYVRWLRNQWFTAIDEDAPEIEAVAFDQWKPNDERQVLPPTLPLFPELNYLEFNGREITGDDFYTSPLIMRCVRSALGSIDLDPASHAMANKHVKANAFFSKHDDGLLQNWHGRVWLNPPFSKWQEWIPKISTEWKSGRIEAMCVYSAMRTITAKYFRPMLDLASGMCVITGRIKNGGLGTDSPDDGHCVLYLGNNVDQFAESFGDIGSVWLSQGVLEEAPT